MRVSNPPSSLRLEVGDDWALDDNSRPSEKASRPSPPSGAPRTQFSDNEANSNRGLDTRRPQYASLPVATTKKLSKVSSIRAGQAQDRQAVPARQEFDATCAALVLKGTPHLQPTQIGNAAPTHSHLISEPRRDCLKQDPE